MEWQFEIFTVQKNKKYGSGIAILAFEKDNVLRCLFALAKVKGEWVYDFFWTNINFNWRRRK